MVEYSVVIPVYNEEKSIKKIVSEVKAVMRSIKKSYEIIVVNDGSSDGTKKILSSLKGIKVLTNENNRGYGYSLKRGIRAASANWIIIIDADQTYSPKDIKKLLDNIEGHDMVIGARVSKKRDIPLLRRPAKWLIGKISNYITNTKIPDLNSGLRVFRKDMVYQFWGLFPDGFSFTTTLTIAALCNNYNVKYVPIDYFKREGKSSINPIRDFIGFNKLLSKIALYFRPLKVFFPLSVLVFMLGVLRGIRDFLLNNSLGELSVILILSSLQIFFFGLLAELIVNRNRIKGP